MPMLADLVELARRGRHPQDIHTAAVVQAATGAVVDQLTVPATPAGYRRLLRLADRYDGWRVWAIESPGGDGAGLTRFLQAQGEQVVVELDRPSGPLAATAPSPIPGATRAATDANASSTRSWWLLAVLSADGWVTSPHLGWSSPAGGSASRPPGMSRPPPPRPRPCGAWPAASTS
jgi:hypothetical protein